MSDQKKVKFTIGDSTHNDSFDESVTKFILGPNPKRRRPTEEMVLGAGQSAAEEDWREKMGVQARNLKALKTAVLTDVTLEVGPENFQFQVHKLLLALGSPVFEAMFYGPLAEKGEKISIPDIMPDGFKVLLRYLYGDLIVLTNEVEALNAWIAADKYCVPKLKKECDSYFCNCPMSSSNIWKLLENAVFLNLTSLVVRCKEYLEKHTESSLSDEGFLQTKIETVQEFLTISSANITELALMKSVIHWGRHKVETEVAVSLAEALKPLMQHFRFGALTPAEFCQFLDESGDSIEQLDSLAILKYLTRPQSYHLPEWCCTIDWPRGFDSVVVTQPKRSSRSVEDWQRIKKFRKIKKPVSSHNRY